MSAPKNLNPAQKKGTPQTLTLCEAPNLDWSRAGTPASDSFDDIYFSVDGGLDETRDVYLKACGLPERWREPKFEAQPFVIGELGFGTGLNFLAAWQMWKAHRQDGQRLHFVSVEKYPLSAEDLARALKSWPELESEARAMLAVWPGRVRGAHILHLGGGVTLTLLHDDVGAAFAGLSMRADAWFLDGFSPAKNPDMWSEAIMARVGELSAGGAHIGTFTAAGFVRQGLAKAGFEVRKTQGFGRKRHRLEAVMPEAEHVAREPITPIIIGAGIAGASLAEAFARRGIMATVVDAGDGTAASGNAAAIVKPRLDRQDSPLARFALSSYLYSAAAYERFGAVLSRGVEHSPQSEDQLTRYKALTDEPALPRAHMYWDDDAKAAVFPRAQVIDPAKARSAMLEGVSVTRGKAVKVEPSEDGLAVMGADGEILAQGSHVFWTVGAGVREVTDFAPLELRYSRGQISWARDGELDAALTYGGYAVPYCEDMLLGATHDRLGSEDPFKVRPEDDAHNLAAYAAATGHRAEPSEKPSRASVRVNSKTTWPFTAELSPRVHILTGLGSRGFVFAPLMAEMVAAQICGEPVDWPKKLRRQI